LAALAPLADLSPLAAVTTLRWLVLHQKSWQCQQRLPKSNVLSLIIKIKNNKQKM
jgi:hypothetical protein